MWKPVAEIAEQFILEEKHQSAAVASWTERMDAARGHYNAASPMPISRTDVLYAQSAPSAQTVPVHYMNVGPVMWSNAVSGSSNGYFFQGSSNGPDDETCYVIVDENEEEPVKPPERKRFKTIGPPAEPKPDPPKSKPKVIPDAQPEKSFEEARMCASFRVYHSLRGGETIAVGQCDTLEDAVLMVKAKFGLDVRSTQAPSDAMATGVSCIDIVDYHGDVVKSFSV